MLQVNKQFVPTALGIFSLRIETIFPINRDYCPNPLGRNRLLTIVRLFILCWLLFCPFRGLPIFAANIINSD